MVGVYEPWLQPNTILMCIVNDFMLSRSDKKAVQNLDAPPGWLSGERVGLVTWWLWVRDSDQANFLSDVFSPLTSAEACEKSSRWLRTEKLC